PEAHALAVRKRAALAPEDELAVAVDGGEELAHEPGLADPRDADQGDEQRRALPARALQCVAERLELASAADERRRVRLVDLDAQPRAGMHGFPHGHRLCLALSRDGLGLGV